MKSYIPILTIAGSDSSGGAGIQADIKTMSALGCYGMSAITAITAQNTTGVSAIQGINPDIVSSQIDMVFNDIPPLATKTGMLFSSEIVESVGEALKRHHTKNIVIDPVMISTSGAELINSDAINKVVKILFPLSTLITPNKSEAKVLTGTDDIYEQARLLHDMGAKNILLKGGDSENNNYKIDYLAIEGESKLIELKSDAIETINSHGTGCTLSSAIACFLAQNYDLATSVRKAKKYISMALFSGKNVSIGNGHGPVNHFFHPDKLKLRKT